MVEVIKFLVAFALLILLAAGLWIAVDFSRLKIKEVRRVKRHLVAWKTQEESGIPSPAEFDVWKPLDGGRDFRVVRCRLNAIRPHLEVTQMSSSTHGFAYTLPEWNDLVARKKLVLVSRKNATTFQALL